jgi:hypothetical protein
MLKHESLNLNLPRFGVLQVKKLPLAFFLLADQRAYSPVNWTEWKDSYSTKLLESNYADMS